MMAKKILVILLIGSMFLAGCGEKTPDTISDEKSQDDSAADVSTSDEPYTEEGDELPADETVQETSEETAEESDGGAYVINGGDPWIDSNLKDNVINTGKLSEKDDFNVAINYDWIISHDIPEGYSRYSSFTKIGEIVEEKAIAALDDDTLTGHDAELVRAVYQGFLNWDERNEEALAPLEVIVKEIEALSGTRDISEYLCDPNRSVFLPSIFEIVNTADLIDSTKYVTALNFGGLILDDSAEYKNKSVVGEIADTEYRKLFSEIYVRMGYSREEADALYDNAIAYETALADSILTNAELQQPDIYETILNYYDPEELYSLTPNFPMEEFIKVRGFGSTKKIWCMLPENIKKISELYTDENAENIKAYLIVHGVIKCAEYLDKQAFDASISATNKIEGVAGVLADKQYAYRCVLQSLPESIGKIYIQKYDCTETKNTITEICKETCAIYREMLSNEEWLSDETRQYAMDKLDAIGINVIEPKEYQDLSDLDLNNLSYFEASMAVEDYYYKLNAANTGGEVNRNLWDNSTLKTNAFYNATNNSINILLGILDGDFYREDMSKEQLYASVGTIIAHEISHAFDPSGSQFDKDGNYNNWWTEDDTAAFQKKAQKLIDYYNGITAFGNEKVNGSIVQGEAVADIAGLKAMLLLASKEEDFNYKLFFESYANMWKEICTYEADYSQLTQNPHPLYYLRVNVVVQQFDEFYETFDVKEGDGMYLVPEDRISVW